MVRRPDERIPVEPLSEPRWARIERSLEARLAEGGDFEDEVLVRRRGWWRSAPALLVAGAAAAAIGALAAHPFFRASSAVSHMETGATGSHLLVGGASIDLAPNTELQVSGDDDRGLVVALGRGEVSCEVEPRHDRPPFVVQAGDVRVRVVGTRFTVKRDQSGVSVDVSRGLVEVEAFGERDSVPAGSHWPSEVTPTPPEASLLASAVAPAPITPGLHTPAARVAPSRTSGSSSTNGSETPSISQPSAAAPSPTQPAPAAPSVATAATLANPSSTAMDARVSPSAQERYEAAARLEARDPAAALASYRQLAREGNDTWAANALYAGARLQADRGARSDAQRMAREYLSRFPHGPNAADAKDLFNRTGSATP